MGLVRGRGMGNGLFRPVGGHRSRAGQLWKAAWRRTTPRRGIFRKSSPTAELKDGDIIRFASGTYGDAGELLVTKLLTVNEVGKRFLTLAAGACILKSG